MARTRIALALALALAATIAAGARSGAHAAPAATAAAPRAVRLGPTLEVAAGPPVRAYRAVTYDRTPLDRAAPWSTFVAEAGPRWHAMWDDATGVPARLFGAGIAVPNAMASPSVAAAFARAFLRRHIDLLAPGARAGDFTLVTNTVHAGIRSVGLVQTHDGLRVLGGQVSFGFKNDRMFIIGSEALPHVQADALRAKLLVDAIADSARAWVRADAADITDRGTVDGPFVLPLVDARGVRAYRTVVRVTVPARAPIGRWDVYIDASTGERVARAQTLMFGAGTVRYDAPVRYPGGGRNDFVADNAQLLVDGAPVATDIDGQLQWTGADAVTVTARARGAFAEVTNDAGAAYTSELRLDPDGTLVWSAADDEPLDAQITSFVHANIAKRYVRTITPDMAWLDETIPVHVNIDDTCNAFSDGDAINFFASGKGCENTGRLADVVYHEFGHSYHAHSIIDGVGAFDPSLSEGVSDYLAATITGDPGMGRGFFFSDKPLRDLDPDTDKVYPADLVGEVHTDGEIIAGALWDLRKALVAEIGEPAGVEHSDFLYQAAIARATDIPSMYAEVLAADDDDGDLSNGTPHECLINEAFGRHGLRAIRVDMPALGAEVPDLDGFHLGMSLLGLSGRCPGDEVAGASIVWQLRGAPDVGGTVPMDTDGTGRYEGVIPVQPEGTVVQYQVVVRLTGDRTLSFPTNLAAPFYELFVGTVVPLYCTDFETDPADDGWTHGLSQGKDSEGADDWQWGAPSGRAGSGDPGGARSGEMVFGNDLGGDNFNGSYQPDKVNFARTPVVEVGNYSTVRLQYRRWLNVEDALYDQATIYANGERAWQNLSTAQGKTHHKDREWRFHDVDLSPWITDGTVQVTFELASDGGLELGGWTLDDVCIVAYAASVCGDGVLTGVEQCDDGDANSDADANACRSNCRTAHCGDGVVDRGEECDDGNDTDDDDCTAVCLRTARATDGGGDCGCRVGGPARRPWAPLALLVIGLAITGRLRRRRARS